MSNDVADDKSVVNDNRSDFLNEKSQKKISHDLHDFILDYLLIPILGKEMNRIPGRI